MEKSERENKQLKQNMKKEEQKGKNKKEKGKIK